MNFILIKANIFNSTLFSKKQYTTDACLILFYCVVCHKLLLSLQIVITPPSFATDGVTWHVTLSCGYE